MRWSRQARRAYGLDDTGDLPAERRDDAARLAEQYAAEEGATTVTMLHLERAVETLDEPTVNRPGCALLYEAWEVVWRHTLDTLGVGDNTRHRTRHAALAAIAAMEEPRRYTIRRTAAPPRTPKYWEEPDGYGLHVGPAPITAEEFACRRERLGLSQDQFSVEARVVDDLAVAHVECGLFPRVPQRWVVILDAMERERAAMHA